MIRGPIINVSVCFFFILISSLLFYIALRQPFVGDDFVWLYNAQYNMNVLHGWIVALTEMNGSGFYRPLTQNVFYFVALHLFGLNVVGFHIAIFVVYLMTAFVLYKLLFQISQDIYSSLAATSVFLFSDINYVGLSWVAAFSETGSNLPFVLALYLYVSDRKSWSYLSFLVCLMCGEITSTLPAFIFVYDFIIGKNSIRASIVRGAVFWLMFLCYIVLRISVIGIHPSGPFAVADNITLIFETMGQSLVWILGWTPTLQNCLHIAIWRIVALASYFLFCFVLAVLSLKFLLGAASKSLRIVFSGLLWVMIGMSPVLLFSLHNYAIYTMAIPLLGFSLYVCGIISDLRSKTYRRLSSFTITASALISSFCAIYNPIGNNRIEGSNVLAQQARYYVGALHTCMKTTNFEAVYIRNGTDAMKWALGDQWGTKMITQRPSIKILYIEPDPELIKKSVVFDATANELRLIACPNY